MNCSHLKPKINMTCNLGFVFTIIFCAFQSTACELLAGEFRNCSLLKSKFSILLTMWFVFAISFLPISIHHVLQAGELNELFTFKANLHILIVHCVVCVFHSFLVYFNPLWITRR